MFGEPIVAWFERIRTFKDDDELARSSLTSSRFRCTPVRIWTPQGILALEEDVPYLITSPKL
jgi:hypothetical protein